MDLAPSDKSLDGATESMDVAPLDKIYYKQRPYTKGKRKSKFGKLFWRIVRTIRKPFIKFINWLRLCGWVFKTHTEPGRAFQKPTEPHNYPELKPWPGGVIPFVLADGFRPSEIKYLEEALNIMETKTCVRFVPRTKEKYYLKVSNNRGYGSEATMGYGN